MRLAAAATVLAGVMFAEPTRAQEIDETKAQKVKAAYLYNFAKFIKWPESAFSSDQAPLEIAVLGDEPFGRIVKKTVKGKTVSKRPIKVRLLRPVDARNSAKLTGSHVLFVGASARTRISEALQTLKGYPVLVVSDIAGFARRGGMIGFVLESGRVEFEINREALDAAKLTASSKLLNLARIVGSNKYYSNRPEVGSAKP